MDNDVRDQVKQRYAQAIADIGQNVKIAAYYPEQLQDLPEGIENASFGCANPTALTDLLPGDTVLDLGSGAGLDVLLSARRVGPAGKAYGLDMTEEMLSEAKANQAKSGVTNAEFILGHIESIPLGDKTVDVVISNCVINLSPDKDEVLKEAFRVLKPGGRFAVADIVTTKSLPDNIRNNLQAWAGCVAGALTIEDYKEKLRNAGFENIRIEVTQEHNPAHYPQLLESVGIRLSEVEKWNGVVASAFVKAEKPLGAKAE